MTQKTKVIDVRFVCTVCSKEAHVVLDVDTTTYEIVNAAFTHALPQCDAFNKPDYARRCTPQLIEARERMTRDRIAREATDAGVPLDAPFTCPVCKGEASIIGLTADGAKALIAHETPPCPGFHADDYYGRCEPVLRGLLARIFRERAS